MAPQLRLIPFLAALIAASASAPALAQDVARTTVFISDTHMGLGRDSTGRWHPTEDFRWSAAFDGFLAYVAAAYPGEVDLVILGDLLELWQPPGDIACRGADSDLGCTPAQAFAIAQRVLAAHPNELASLARFASGTGRRVVVVPGNHDSSLMLDDVWAALAGTVAAPPGRFERMTSGVWTSTDGIARAEHGHQIGRDANRYDAWPQILSDRAGSLYIQRPWGERFVQKLFNAEEAAYPIIDNLGPESAGARYRLADVGLARTAADLSRFVAFNLFETSLRQKAQVLGDECAADDGSCPEPTRAWDLDYARTLGSRLFSESLPQADPFRGLILDAGDRGRDLRAQLVEQLQAMSDDEVWQLCEHAALERRVRCVKPTLGAFLEKALNTKEQVLRAHLARASLHASTRFFVYGHTHQLEEPWELVLAAGRRISVANTGAFQRVIDEAGFVRRMKARRIEAQDALRTLTLDDLPACYTFVVVSHSAPPQMDTRRWYQPEDGAGRRVEVSDAVCR